MIVIGLCLLISLVVWLGITFVIKRGGQAAQPEAVPPKPLEISDGFEVRLSLAETLIAIAITGSVCSSIGLLFYGSIWIALLFFFLGCLYPRILLRRKKRKVDEQFASQFRQLLYSLSSLLSAGRSVENAFRDAASDLQLIYPDPHTLILIELTRIVGRLDRGESIEIALSDLARRSDQEDVRNFSEVFIICKRTGGNLVEVIRRTSHILADKMEVKQEITVMLAQKKFESRVLAISPLVVVAFLKLSSPDYMAPLYGNAQGMVIMTLALGVLCASMWLSGLIMRIKV
jgi:tight adherence protein B